MAVTPQAAVEPQDVSLLGGDFPPGLNTAEPASNLDPNETPDAYGFDLSKDGVIAKATIASASSRTLKTVTLTESAVQVPYFLAYRRLWNLTNRTLNTGSPILTYGAMNYEDIYVPQGLGKIHSNETASNILAIQPFGSDSMWIGTASGGYVLSNISDSRGFWHKSDIIEEVELGGATGLLEWNGVVYSASTNGLYAYDRGQSVEITRKVRNDLTNFGNVALTCDYEKGYIKGGASYIYEAPTKKLFRWNTTTPTAFRYTSPQFRLRDWAPFSVDALWLIVNHTDTDDGYFKWQVKVEDDFWSDEETQVVAYENGSFTAFRLMMDTPLDRTCRKWQVRLTDLASNLQIKELRLESEDFGMTDFSQ